MNISDFKKDGIELSLTAKGNVYFKTADQAKISPKQLKLLKTNKQDLILELKGEAPQAQDEPKPILAPTLTIAISGSNHRIDAGSASSALKEEQHRRGGKRLVSFNDPRSFGLELNPHRCRNLMANHGEYKVWKHRDDPREFYTCAICHPSPVNPANLIFKTIRNHVSNN